MKYVNAKDRAEAFPETFKRPSNKELNNLKEGDFVKVCSEIGEQGERFWVELVRVTDNLLLGRVDNHLIFTDRIGYDSIIFFHRDAIYAIH